MRSLLTTATGASVETKQLLALKGFSPRLAKSKPNFLSHMAGQYLSRSRGRGLEFAEVRHYQQGDDIRSIDWRVTARSGKPHTRLYVEEREKPVIIFCDQRHSMRFGTRKRFKSVQAANLAALLAWGSLAAGDRVGGIIAAPDGHLEIRPSRSHKTVSQYLGLVAEKSQTDRNIADTSLEQLLEEVRRVAKPGTSAFLISDFSDWNNNCEQRVAQITRHCNVHLLSVSDPFERNLPKSGDYPITDGQQDILLSGKQHGTQIAQLFANRQQQLHDLCQKLGASFIHIGTEDDAETAATQCLKGLYAKR